MTAIGAALAIIVGFVLGLLGGGGGVLTVPILVYGLHLPVKAAVPTSLCVVGLVAVIGFLSHLRQGNVAPRVAAVFAPFAVASAFAGARIARYIPSEVQLIVFAIVGLVASFFMIRGRRVTTPAGAYRFDATPRTIALLGLQASGVGLLTGIIGIGGGFLIVPALVLVAKVPMRLAVGTSLLVITMNALGGFAGYVGHAPIDWRVIVWFTAFAIVGTLAGTVASARVPQQRLRQVFGILLVGVSLYTLYKR
jgi:uncharacterized membrane protein YfcA